MARPLVRMSAAELEKMLDSDPENHSLRVQLLHELSFRETSRALKLKKRIEGLQAGAQQKKLPANETGRPTVASAHPEASTAVQVASKPADQKTQAPIQESRPEYWNASVTPSDVRPALQPRPLTNEPENILTAWTALEVLSPPSFTKPEQLASGEVRRIAELKSGSLPWENGGEPSRGYNRLFYQVILGTVDMALAMPPLISVYSDVRAERPPTKGEAVLAVLVLDKEGRPVEFPSVAISSFAWGLPHALDGELDKLGHWRTVERDLVRGLDEFIRRKDKAGNPRPLTCSVIKEAYQYILERTRLSPDLVRPPRFAIRTYHPTYLKDPPEPVLLNSFFLGDLDAARKLYEQGKTGAALDFYLGARKSHQRQNVLKEFYALEAAVAPGLMPPGRWPSKGRHPLVLLQQAAVNLAFQVSAEKPILAVNGPPGTGKTTLLRDIVAGLVIRRAEAMASYDDPEKAFIRTTERIRSGNSTTYLHKLAPELKGFEMVVASSNNKAVENVSQELPLLKAVADDISGLNYFTTISDSLQDGQTWGLIAAVLGNQANRNKFRQAFWRSGDTGIGSYLLHAAGTPQVFQVKDKETDEVIEERTPKIVENENPPANKQQAMARWKVARKEFLDVLKRSQNAISVAEDARKARRSLDGLLEAEVRARAICEKASHEAAQAKANLEQSAEYVRLARSSEARARAELSASDACRPGFFARLFRSRNAVEWSLARRALEVAFQNAQGALAARQATHAQSEHVVNAARHQLGIYNASLTRAIEAQEAAHKAIAAYGNIRNGVPFDEEFFAQDHAKVQKTAPWLGPNEHAVRDEVFVTALKLHKAFIDTAAVPLRQNLAGLMAIFGGRSLDTAEQQGLIPDLWSSFFLVVPLISTTFASVERMFDDIPPETLGWLLIDEAGQAVPQAAVGAMMRTKRAIVVGDPAQIEPVVTLPGTLTKAICRHFGVGAEEYNAPEASAQTLADAATPYYAEFQTKDGVRPVGVPLLVHRRCEDPMFRISNAIAYQRLMVQAKSPAQSPIRDVLGPSTWIDIQGSGADKWCEEEGQVVLDLLRRITAAGCKPDVYIVTPFVVVQDNLRRIVRASGLIQQWGEDWMWARDRIGTVHTVQGREAEAVIFVLGAPKPDQVGARSWAGGAPNLLNVAITRAKEALYVVGNKEHWKMAGVFEELVRQIDR